MKTQFKALALAAVVSSISSVATADEGNAQLQVRIVGGVSTNIAVAPSTVALINNGRFQATGSYFSSQFCGGTVIADRWVLTAAHCVVSDEGVMDPTELSVFMGSGDLRNPINPLVGVTRVVPHSRYSEESNSNDIALLKLEFDALVPSAALDDQPVELNDLAIIAGWGALNEGGDGATQFFPTMLQSASVRMIPGASCEVLFPIYTGFVDNTNVCAGLPEGGVDTCQGDSGGPLYRVEANSDSVTVLTGVTSFGAGCGGAMAPGVYASVAAYEGWIEDILRGSTDSPVSGISDDDPTVIAPSGAAAGLESGGGSLSWIVGLLGLVALLRRVRVRRMVAMFMALFVYYATQSAHACGIVDDMDSTLISAQQMIGKSREALMHSEPFSAGFSDACQVERTGFGFSKRAYFLETCNFGNHAKSVCGEASEKIEYAFLEDKLVRILFSFDSLNDKDRFMRCLSMFESKVNPAAIPELTDDLPYSVVVGDLSKISKIHRLKNKDTNETVVAYIDMFQ